MPSIQDIAKKTSTKMFQQASSRPLDEVLPLDHEKPSAIESKIVEPKKEKKVFKKVPYRPWDDDKPTPEEGKGVYGNLLSLTDQSSIETVAINKHDLELPTQNNIIALHKPEIEKNTATRMIISLYGVQRNILKFLINNISYDEGPFIYTFPIDLKSIVMFTSSSKRTVETSIRRMKEKNIIESWDHKRGRGGYVTFRIQSRLRDEFLNQNNKPIQPII